MTFLNCVIHDYERQYGSYFKTAARTGEYVLNTVAEINLLNQCIKNDKRIRRTVRLSSDLNTDVLEFPNVQP